MENYDGFDLDLKRTKATVTYNGVEASTPTLTMTTTITATTPTIIHTSNGCSQASCTCLC